ncbi:hypothetical protein C8F01DRAFT_1017602, partial [Mycena amicta]
MDQLTLPQFLKVFTANNIPMAKAMLVASKCYKEFSTPGKLSELDEVKLLSLGIDDKDLRKQTVMALRKAGYSQPQAGPSQSAPAMTAVEVITTPTKRKRTKPSVANEFLPTRPKDESEDLGSLDFNEVLDEEVLKTKSTVVNRAPLLTAWATLVAEKIGFQREEALSIASVFTEINALAKGISIGKYNKSVASGMEGSPTGTQPYVDIMGRRLHHLSRPLFQDQNSQWRGLSAGKVAQPSTAFAYISRAFRQTTPHIIGAMRLLLATYSVEEINGKKGKGWGLYADFRPEVVGWGDRAQVLCSTILGLRQAKNVVEEPPATQSIVKTGTQEVSEPSDEPPPKKVRSLEEYEAELDKDRTFDHVDLD